MQINYEISESDFISASKLASSIICWGGRYRVLLYPSIGLLWIVTVALQAESTGIAIRNWIPFLPALFFFCVPVLAPYQRARLYRKLPLLQGRHSLNIADENLNFISPKSEATISWDNYDRVAEDSHSFVLILQGKKQFQIIPKHELSPLQIDELRALFQQHLSAK